MKTTYSKSWARLLLECNVKTTYSKSWAGIFRCGLTLDPLLQGQTRIAKFKNAYNSLIIGPRGLQCETNLYEIMG